MERKNNIMRKDALLDKFVGALDKVNNVTGFMIDMGFTLTEGANAGLLGTQGRKDYARGLVFRAEVLGTATRGSRLPLMWLSSKHERAHIRSEIDQALKDFWKNEAKPEIQVL